MSRILVVGNKNQIMDEYCALLQLNYETMKCGLGIPEFFIENVQEFCPDLILACLDGLKRERLSGIAQLRDSIAYNNTVIVAIGSKEECKMFNQYVNPGATRALLRPVSNMVIEQTVEEFFPHSNKRVDAKTNKAGQQREILLVDDEPIVLRLLRASLQEIYKVICVTSGEQALSYLENNKKPDAILLDYLMPGKNGMDTLEEIHKNEELKDIPVVFLTGTSDRDKVMKCIALKPQGYLVKPVSKEQLLDKLEQLFI